MKIIDVRDGFIKFEADKSIYLSSFIQVNGESKSYIAQVNQLKTFGEVAIAGAKILFIFEDNELKNYDKTEPSKDSEITGFTMDILNNSINAKRPVIVGKTLDNTENVKIDASAFNKKMLISADDKNIHNTLIRNFSKQFENLGMKTVVLDTLGVIEAKKFKAGVDFKLPLDTSSLIFMYESCLSDATADSKSTIVEIFRDLSEYSKTVPFVPFGTLKAIVDDMVDHQHIFKLLVLKNKLAKFEKLGYFASSQNEVDNLKKILDLNCAIIDLTGMDTLFQNRYVEYIYEKLNTYNNVQVFLETANTVSKKNLKNVIEDLEIPTALATHSKFQYLNDIKNMFDNFIIEPTAMNNAVFGIYSSFFGSMKKNMYLIAGEAINYIPIVSEAQVIDEVIPYTPCADQDETGDDASLNEIAENDTDVVDISLNENESECEIVEDAVIAAIDEKSDNAIAAVTDNLETPEGVNLFENEEDEAQEEVQERETEEVSEPDAIDLEEEPAGNEDLLETADEILSENKEEFIEDAVQSDLEEVNEDSVNICDVPDEEIVIDESELATDVSVEELSEDMLKEKAEIITEEILQEESGDELIESDISEQNDGFALEEDVEETTVELDNDTDILAEEQEESIIEEYPQNTTIDVDFTEPKIMPLSGEALNHDFDEIVELDSSEATEDDIIIDMSNNEQINIDEDREQEILEEVDKVYTTIKDDDKIEEISDSDLDLIDELNNDGEELEEYQGELDEISDSDNGILEEAHLEQRYNPTNDADEILEHRESSTPIVPLYDADIPQEDMVMSDPIQQGDAVIHAKYGNGVVEKMIKYGTKTLYAINFENIGRRLLDPTLTEIKRV